MSLHRLALGLLLLSPFLAGGCTGLHFYNKADHELAIAAKDSFNEAKLDELVKNEYELNQQTLKYQLLVVRRHTLSLRDATLATVINNPESSVTATRGQLTYGFLHDRIEHRLVVQLGAKLTDRYDIAKMLRLFADIQRKERLIKQYEIAIKTTSDNDYIETVAKPGLDRDKREKAELEKQLNAHVHLESGGALTKLMLQISELEAQAESNANQAKQAKAAFDAQKRVYEKAIAESTGAAEGIELVGVLLLADQVIAAYDAIAGAPAEEQEAKKKLFLDAIAALVASVEQVNTSETNKKAARSLLEAASGLKTAASDSSTVEEAKADARKKLASAIHEGYSTASAKGNAVAFARVVQDYLSKVPEALDNSDDVLADLGLELLIPKLAAQLEAVNEMLDEFVASNGALPEDTSAKTKTNERIAKSLRVIADHYNQSQSFPAASALLMEAERLRIELEAAKQRLDRGRTHIALLNRKLSAMLLEVQSLADARRSLKELRDKLHPNTTDWKQYERSIAQDYRENKDQQEQIGRMLYYYANSWTLGRAAQEEADYRLIALRHDAALDATATAVAQWHNLIVIPLSRQEAYHASGVTPEAFAQFLQAVGLGAIAAR